jgi:hypothetical protein
MAKRIFMQMISCINVSTIIQNGLYQLDADWAFFKVINHVIVSIFLYENPANEIVEERVTLNLRLELI